MDAIDEAWASHDAMRAAVDDFRQAATEYLDGSAVPDLAAERHLLDLARAAAAHLAVPFEAAPDQEAAHLEYELLKAENERLRTVEREALRVLGAVIYYAAGGVVSLSEGALTDDYTVERAPDVAAAKVCFKAWPTTRHAP